jgi:hypothetical protein
MKTILFNVICFILGAAVTAGGLWVINLASNFKGF